MRLLMPITQMSSAPWSDDVTDVKAVILRYVDLYIKSSFQFSPLPTPPGGLELSYSTTPFARHNMSVCFLQATQLRP